MSIGLVGCGSTSTTTSSSTNNTTATNTIASTTTNSTTSSANTVNNSTTNSTTTSSTSSSDVEVIELTSSTIAYNGEHGWSFGRANDSMAATLTLSSDGTIQSVELSQVAWEPKSRQYQNNFANTIASSIVGKNISNVEIGKVGGASNTSDAFNDALDSIRLQFTS